MTDKICFVIQPFSDLYENRYKSVYEPAIKDADLIPYRTGGHSVDDIPEDIRQRICEAHICFADITEDRPNVWYEVGFAHARGKQVVMVCDEEKRPSEDLPFDISVRNVLFYEGKQVDSKKFYRDGVIKDIIERVKARSEESDAVQQSPNSDNTVTEIDGKVLKKMFEISLESREPMLPESVVSRVSGEKRVDVLTAIDKMGVAGYIKEIISSMGGKFIGYRLTEKGRQWYHDNKSN